MYITIIIPAYNEEHRLPSTLDKVVNYFSSKKYLKELIVVNDCSTDKTSEVIKSHSVNYPYIREIKNTQNRGKAYSVNRGIREAKGELVLFMDADGSTSISELDKLMNWIQNGYDIAIGSRRVDGSSVIVDQNKFRLLLGWIFRHIVKIIMPLDIIDTQNGFKLFKSKVAKELFSKQKSFGWAFDVEILYLAQKSGYKIKEVPIVWVNNFESKVKFFGKIKMLFDILKISFEASPRG